MLKSTRWTVAGFFICALSAGAVVGRPSVAQVNDQAESLLKLDEPPILPELLSIPPIGPYQITDIVPTGEGFLVATGAGVSRWRYVDGLPRFQEAILRADGSPLGHCQKLLPDKKGGCWICGVGGVGYLARDENVPKWFSAKDGLSTGGVGDMALSDDGKRLWVIGPGGLATTNTEKYRWRVFKKHNLVDLAIHPSQAVVWCRQLHSFHDGGARIRTTVAFDLSTGQWLSIPGFGEFSHVAAHPTLYRKASGWVWFSDVPLAIDLKANKVHTWPRKPLWERTNAEGATHYRDQLGQIVSTNDETGDVWYASTTGVWRYSQAANRWKGYKFLAEPLYGHAKVIWSHDRRTLYWSCAGNVAAFDTTTHTWRPLWSHEKSDDPLLLSPNGKTLWQIGPWGVAVGDPERNTGRVLNDTAVLGLARAKFVRFDEDRNLALIATPRGIVITDYHGLPRATLTNPAPHVQHPVVEFRFTADGNEVWCLEQSMPPHVYFPKTREWQKAPSAQSKGFLDVAFSKDGGTVWLSRRSTEKGAAAILQRKSGTRAWKPLNAKIPDHVAVKKFYLTPGGDELWMTTRGDGVFRAGLTDGKVTHYRETHYLEDEGVTQRPLVEDYVADLVFVQKGTVAVCAAGGGGNTGLSLIDLKTNTVKNLLLGEVSSIQILLVEPDDRTITCIFNNAPSRKFDTKERKWHGKGPVGVGDDEWFGRSVHDTSKPLAIGGNYFLIRDERGIVKVNSKGDELDVFSPASGQTGFSTPHILPIPGGDEHLCAIVHKEQTGIYRLHVKSRKLRLVKRFVGNVAALKIAPDGRAWAGMTGRIICFDTVTGKEFPLWPNGKSRLPVAVAVKDLPDSTYAGITIAPRKIGQASVLPTRESPKLGKAVAMNNRGMVWPSTGRPLIATSESGKRYVMWFAYPGKTKAALGGLPLIPRELLPKAAAAQSGRTFEGATGLRVWSKGKWSDPQLLFSGKIPAHDVQAAWCRGEDLHVLLVSGTYNRLTHLCFQSAENKWTKIAELDHGVIRIEIRRRYAHLVTSDYEGNRFGYRAFDGDHWSDVQWFKRRGDYTKITLAVIDATAHLIWNEGGGAVVHVVVHFPGQAQVFRQTFGERPIYEREYLAVAATGGSLALMYVADLYENHPDSHLPHMRTWLDDHWSVPKTIPFPTRGFVDPTAVRHGDQTLVSWSYVTLGEGYNRILGYSILDENGVWTTPAQLCLNDKGKPLDDPFVVLHIDRHGQVYTAWNEGLDKAETFFAEVTRLRTQSHALVPPNSRLRPCRHSRRELAMPCRRCRARNTTSHAIRTRPGFVKRPFRIRNR